MEILPTSGSYFAASEASINPCENDSMDFQGKFSLME